MSPRDPAALVAGLAGLEDLESREPVTPDEEDAALREAVTLLGRGGLLAWLVPGEAGGAQTRVRNADLCALREALARRSGLADLAFVMQGLGTGAIAQRGSPEQKEKYLPAAARGESIAAIGLTEPGAGSDLTAIATRARRDGSGYVLDGAKTLISNAGLADIYTVWARTSDDPRGGLTAFIVEQTDPGFSLSERLRAMAPHPIGSLSFSGCRLGAERRIGQDGEGLAIALGVLDFFRPTVGAAAVGFARRALDETCSHMKSRVQFGEPLAARQGLQAMLADMATEIEAAALMVTRAADAIDSGRGRTARESAMAKYFATETAWRVVDRAVQIHGGRGVMRGSVVERLYREVRALRIYEGTSEVQKNIIAREILRGSVVKLLEPIDVGALKLRNRIVLPAMVTRLSGEDGFVNRDIIDRYARFARGEPGLMVIEAMSVHGGRSGPLLRISDDGFLPGLIELRRAVHDAGDVKVIPQVIHFLKLARSGWRQKIGDLTLEEIGAIVECYASAASRARMAGFDGVELHMAHAYTLSSFLSLRNVRRDEYGTSLENRMRLPVEVIAAVRRAVGGDFPVGVRFDAEECIKDGYTVVDAARMALRFALTGADYLSLSAGGKFEDAIHKEGDPLYPYTGYSGDRCMPSVNYPDGANTYMAAAVKAHLVARGCSAPVITTGKIRSPRQAEEILQSGAADLIGMARALLADPDWPRKVREGREESIVRCVYGNVCKNLDENFKKVRCVLWPRGELQAPSSTDTIPPAWKGGKSLVAAVRSGHIQLLWKRAQDNEAVYGYEILRSGDGGNQLHLTTVKGSSYNDHDVEAGVSYRYWVRAYDLAGNRSEALGPAVACLPWPDTARPRAAGSGA